MSTSKIIDTKPLLTQSYVVRVNQISQVFDINTNAHSVYLPNIGDFDSSRVPSYIILTIKRVFKSQNDHLTNRIHFKLLHSEYTFRDGFSTGHKMAWLS